MGNDLTPHEMAEDDEAAAERMHQVQEVDANIAHGYESIAGAMANLGFDEAANNAELSADQYHDASIKAKVSAETYEGAAKSWTEVERDLAEQAKLTGEMYAAGATVRGAHQTLAGAHSLTDDQRTELELIAAKENAAIPVFQERAAAMGKEAFDDTQHAQAEEASARLGDPESGLSNQ